MSYLTLIPSSAGLSAGDRAALADAYEALERSTLAGRITGLIGRQVDLASQMLPKRAREVAARATTLALRAALHVAMRGIEGRRGRPAELRHRAFAVATGAAGGALGPAALPFELPASTIIMMRAIADIARAHGEDMRAPETALACLEVFALGGRSRDGGDHLNSGYFAARTLLARSVSEAAQYIAQKGVVDEAAPALVRFVALVAQRFGVTVTQKLAAQIIPVLGAVGGAAVNYAFIDYFQSIARGHFTVRRLERLYGAELVRAEYETLASREAKPEGSRASA